MGNEIFGTPKVNKPPVVPLEREPDLTEGIRTQRQRFKRRVTRDSLKVGLSLPDENGRVGLQIPRSME